MPPTYLLRQGLHGGDVDTAPLRVLQQHPQDGELRTDGLPAARGGPHKHIVITVVDGVEHWKPAEPGGGWEHQGEKRLRPLLRTEDTRRNSASQSAVKRQPRRGWHQGLYLQSAYSTSPPIFFLSHTGNRAGARTKRWGSVEICRMAEGRRPSILCLSLSGTRMQNKKGLTTFLCPSNTLLWPLETV